MHGARVCIYTWVVQREARWQFLTHVAVLNKAKGKQRQEVKRDRQEAREMSRRGGVQVWLRAPLPG